MADQTVKTAPQTTAPATDAKTAKSETVRVSGNIPADLYDALYNNHRFDVRKDKGEFLEFVLTEYAKSVNIKL